MIKNALVPLAIAVVLTACATIDPKQQLPRETGLQIMQKTDNLLYSQNVVSPSAVQGVADRITKYATNDLQKRGIKVLAPGSADGGKAKLVVELTTIENDVTSEKDFWTGRVTSQGRPRITYALILTSPTGAPMLNGEWTDYENGLDNLCRKIGEKIGRRVAEWYR